jgi:hypothetical protein
MKEIKQKTAAATIYVRILMYKVGKYLEYNIDFERIAAFEAVTVLNE